MECNLKAPLQWECGNQPFFLGKDNEITKFTTQTEWRVELGGVISNGSVHSSCSGTYFGSDLGNGSSRSSISASVGSSSKVGATISEYNLESVEGLHQNPNKNYESTRDDDSGTSPGIVGGIGVGEPPIGLKLGKRTYFEDVGSANIKTSSSSISMTPDTDSCKNPCLSHQATQNIYCQVEGCHIDLAGAKDYHRKHKVCENHSKTPKVMIAGQERRFCQQCSRFHDLSEFDQKKRSCRKRLSEHNSRRRKPLPETISFNSNGLSSSFCVGAGNGQQMNIFFSQAPGSHAHSSASTMWEKSSVFSFSTNKGSWSKPTKIGVNGASSYPMIDFSDTFPALHHGLNRIMPFKGSTAEVLNQGMEDSIFTSNLNGAPDLQRALSLLSNDSCSPGNTGQTNMFPFPRSNSDVACYPPFQPVNSLVECWHDEQSLAEQALTFNFHSNGSQFQELHLNKVPYESPLFEGNQVFSKSESRFLEFKT